MRTFQLITSILLFAVLSAAGPLRWDLRGIHDARGSNRNSSRQLESIVPVDDPSPTFIGESSTQVATPSGEGAGVVAPTISTTLSEGKETSPTTTLIITSAIGPIPSPTLQVPNNSNQPNFTKSTVKTTSTTFSTQAPTPLSGAASSELATSQPLTLINTGTPSPSTTQFSQSKTAATSARDKSQIISTVIGSSAADTISPILPFSNSPTATGNSFNQTFTASNTFTGTLFTPISPPAQKTSTASRSPPSSVATLTKPADLSPNTSPTSDVSSATTPIESPAFQTPAPAVKTTDSPDTSVSRFTPTNIASLPPSDAFTPTFTLSSTTKIPAQTSDISLPSSLPAVPGFENASSGDSARTSTFEIVITNLTPTQIPTTLADAGGETTKSPKFTKTPTISSTTPSIAFTQIPTILPPPASTAPVSPADFSANLAEAQSYNTLFEDLNFSSRCKAGEIACINGNVGNCNNAGNFVISICNAPESCFAMPMNNTKGVIVGCTNAAAAANILSGGAASPSSPTKPSQPLPNPTSVQVTIIFTSPTTSPTPSPTFVSVITVSLPPLSVSKTSVPQTQSQITITQTLTPDPITITLADPTTFITIKEPEGTPTPAPAPEQTPTSIITQPSPVQTPPSEQPQVTPPPTKTKTNDGGSTPTVYTIVPIPNPTEPVTVTVTATVTKTER